MTILDYKTGEPPYVGYYLVRCDKKYRIYKERDLLPTPMYWNGEEWQTTSDKDAEESPGGDKPFTFPFKVYPEWVEVAK